MATLKLGERFCLLFFKDLSFSHLLANPGPGSPIAWEGFGDFGKAGNCFLKDKIQTPKSSLGTHTWSWK